MERILIWTEADVAGLARALGLSRIVTEVDARGVVTRELGFDANGDVVHRHPGEPARAKHGVFDLATIPSSANADMTAEEFDRFWSA